MILGEHERNTDTMIVAHVNRALHKTTLISFPRDLYWKGLKFGSYNQKFGPEQFMKEFEEVTGLTIKKYIRIDMFAFIDAVNALGGIEVELDTNLYDPTYKTFDHGQWSTLFYPAGTHTLNGIETLRIARSRATTMDFGRAKRQHLILQGISKKISEVASENPVKLYPLLEVLLKYVETNLSPFEIVELVSSFRNARIDSGHTLDTDNVLFNTYSNIYFFPEGADILSPDFDMGQWILLPRAGNWDYIKWYIWQIINDEAE